MSVLKPSIVALVMVSMLPFTAVAVNPAPDPNLPPERVVEIQLTALQQNDHPQQDAGIRQTWVFAHPYNKSMTGPLDRFAAMIKGPGYRMLVDHRAHTIEQIYVADDRALFAVTIVPESGPVVFYTWTLAKVRSGPLAGSWMTIAVSPPFRRGDSI